MSDRTNTLNLHDEEEQIKLNELEKAGNETEIEADEHVNEDDTHTDRTDYSSFSKADFVRRASEIVHNPDIHLTHEMFKKMRLLFDDIIKKEKEIMIKKYVEEGNEPRTFSPPPDEQKHQFYQQYTAFLERRAKEKERAEQEKMANLQKKKAILEKMKQLTESKETEHSLQELKELQREWKSISRVPREQMADLWETYKILLDKFYDNLSIFNELKDLDRQKNLEAKIDLTKKVGELMQESSIKKSHILLNKYHEDFKNIGPVPTEFSEDVWNRFKMASDILLERNKNKIEELKEIRRKNLEIKILLCEKMEQISTLTYGQAQEWASKSKEVDALFNDWKKAGPIPESISDQIWKRFREAMNQFYDNKKEYFNRFNKDKEDNYQRKIAICEKAETLSESSDYEKTAAQLIQLQEKWKTIGPVPDKYSDDVWKRFRAACDTFFKRRNINRDSIKKEEQDNYNLKSDILTKMENLLKADSQDKSDILQQLSSLQKEWNNIGHVPRNRFKKMKDQYEQVTDNILKTHQLSQDEFKKNRFKEHLEILANKPNGHLTLKVEERKIMERIKVLKSELETYSNNIEFFSNSKSADTFKKQFEEKMEKSQKQIDLLEGELKTIRQYSRRS